MSSYREFADGMLKSLYDANIATPDQYSRFEKISRASGLSPRRDWITRFVEEVEGNGFAQVAKHMGAPAEWSVRIRAAGSEYVEDVLGYEGGAQTTSNGIFDPNIFDPEIFDTGEKIEERFSSAKWTGITDRLSPQDRAKIVELSGSLQALVLQSELDERTTKTVLKHVEAVETLLNAPDPPWKAIVDLLSHPAVAALLAAKEIMQIIWNAAS